MDVSDSFLRVIDLLAVKLTRSLLFMVSLLCDSSCSHWPLLPLKSREGEIRHILTLFFER